MGQQTTNQSSNGKRKKVEKSDNINKIINHPNATNDDSSKVSNVIRNWYRQKKEDEKEDYQILGDQRIKKLYQK